MHQNILALRLARQCLCKPIEKDEYDKLFRLMSPVQTIYWCCPGDPPCLAFRAAFNDQAYCFDKRADRAILKGRFQNGGIAYILEDDLELFGVVYRKEPKKLSGTEGDVLDVLQREGPMNIRLIKEFSGMRSKDIVPALHKLQEKFLVFEDQTDNEGDRARYLLQHEFPTVDLNRWNRREAIKILILRFIYLNVFIDSEMVRSFYKLPAKDIAPALAELAAEGKITATGKGYMLIDDQLHIQSSVEEVAQSVFVLHRNDFLVKSNEYWLKDKYKQNKLDILQYLFIDGDFNGAVLGHFRNGPFDVEDVVLDLPAKAALERKEEIIAAIGRVNDPQLSPVKRYMGIEI